MAAVEIPPKYKCVRCHGDLRETTKNNRCKCFKKHPLSASKSGDKFIRTVIQYKGSKE